MTGELSKLNKYTGDQAARHEAIRTAILAIVSLSDTPLSVPELERCFPLSTQVDSFEVRDSLGELAYEGRLRRQRPDGFVPA
jgi:hypothetical protein